MKNYRLCGFSQGASRTQGWIEERGAILGASVEIMELGGFWEVIGVGDVSKSKEEVHEVEARARKPFTAMKAYRTKH
jgi:hypothetical protein